MSIIIIFCFWYILKIGLWVYYFAMRRMGKGKDYKGVPADGQEGIHLQEQGGHTTLATPSS